MFVIEDSNKIICTHGCNDGGDGVWESFQAEVLQSDEELKVAVEQFVVVCAYYCGSVCARKDLFAFEGGQGPEETGLNYEESTLT